MPVALDDHDRIQSDEFAMTHEFMAVMLGVRRPTVTLVMAQLTSRGHDLSRPRPDPDHRSRRAREGASCECYRTVRSLFDRLLPSRRRCSMIQPSRNTLLAALPAAEYQRLAPYLQSRRFRRRGTVDTMRRHARVFPESGMCSLSTVMEDGRTSKSPRSAPKGLVGTESAPAGDSARPEQTLRHRRLGTGNIRSRARA